MDVILTEDIPKLGNAGQVVRVKDGYARNFLLPRGKALLATRGRVSELEHKTRMIEERQRKEISGLEGVVGRLASLALEFEVNASDEGKLFGSVTNADIAAKIAESGIEVDRRKIELPEPIRQLGEYDVAIRLHREVVAQVAVKVSSAGGPPPPEEKAEQAEDEEPVEESQEV